MKSKAIAPMSKYQREVFNPSSGRFVAVGSATHRRLLRERRVTVHAAQFQFRGNGRTWRDMAPQSTGAREKLFMKCPDCFIIRPNSTLNKSNRPKFPIGLSKKKCPDCRGLRAAVMDASRPNVDSRVRAYVLRKALPLLRKHCKSVPRLNPA